MTVNLRVNSLISNKAFTVMDYFTTQPEERKEKHRRDFSKQRKVNVELTSVIINRLRNEQYI